MTADSNADSPTTPRPAPESYREAVTEAANYITVSMEMPGPVTPAAPTAPVRKLPLILTQLAALIEEAAELHDEMVTTHLPGHDQAWDLISRFAAGFGPTDSAATTANVSVEELQNTFDEFCRDLNKALGYTTGGPTAPQEIIAAVRELQSLPPIAAGFPVPVVVPAPAGVEEQ
jgi:hypothetical protein